MRLPKDILNVGLYTKPNFFLCNTDKEKICKLETTETKGVFKFNSTSELSFETARVYNDIITGETKVNPFFDKIEAFRLIFVEDFGYFELQGPELTSDGITEKKSCKAYSLEYVLAQKYLDDFYVNIGTVESIEVINAESESNIIPVTLYNPSNPKLSLLHLALDEVYGWKIGHVDASLQTLSRQFEIDRTSVYDFLMEEVCEKFNCYIVFDTINNTINVYAESLTAKFICDGYTNMFTITPPFTQICTVSIDGYKTTKWNYNATNGVLTLDDIPESGSHVEVIDGALTEWETDVFISFDNLAQEVNINYDADEIKTKLTVTYGDDYDIREVNLGLPYLTDISYYYTVDWMGQDLYDAYTRYMQKSTNSQSEYAKNSQEIIKFNDCISYEENRLSFEYSLAQSVNSLTVGTYYVRQENLDGSFYYKEVSLPSEYKVDVGYYSNVTTNVNEQKVSDLYAVLKKYFNNEDKDGEDTTSWKTDLDELKSDFEFMETYTLDYLSSEMSKIQIDRIGNDTVEAAINNFLDEMWNEIGRNPLQKLYLEPYQQIKTTNIEAGWSQTNNESYPYYYPVIIYIASIEKAISERDVKIKEYKDEQSVFINNNAVISDSLLMRNNFTEGQLIRLSAFLREDELHIEDIVETSLDDLSSSFKVKQDAMESGKIELQKLCQPQLQFSMTMANIYALSEFEPIINQFQLGKVIKVCLRPDYIKQSRLLQVDINFDDFSDFSCEFGELTSLRTQSDIHADLLGQAISAGKSVATNSSYWTRGSDQAAAIDLKIQQGLLDATTQIKAIDGSQGVVIDKYGIHLQEINANGEINPKQGWITNNKILYTDDGFKSTKSVFGEYKYDDKTYYGILAEAVVGSLLIGSQIKIENNDGSMTFDNNGMLVTNEINSFVVNPNSEKLIKISNDTQDIFYVDNNGNLNITGTIFANSGNIGGCEISEGVLKIKNANISEKITAAKIDIEDVVTVGDIATSSNVTTITNETIKTTNVLAENLQVKSANIDGQIIASQINTTGLIAENISATTISGKTIRGGSLLIGDKDGDYSEITTTGVLNCVGATITGNITANDGEIGGWLIKDNRIVSQEDETKSVFYLASPSATDYDNWIAAKNDSGIDTFNVSKTGKLYAREADIGGAITAGSGSNIGGWSVDSNSIYAGDWSSSDYRVFMSIGSLSKSYTIANESRSDWVFGAGEAFGVTKGGKLYASGATINGVLTAGIGSSIGGFEVDENSLYKGEWVYSTANPENNKSPDVFMCTGTKSEYNIGGVSRSGWAFGAGSKFGVTKDGDLFASSVDLTGKITATSGTIGSWNIITDPFNGAFSILGADFKKGEDYYGMGFRPYLLKCYADTTNDTDKSNDINQPVFAIGKLNGGWYNDGDFIESTGLDGNWNNANFYVLADGTLHAKNATFDGQLSSGTYIGSDGRLKFDAWETSGNARIITKDESAGITFQGNLSGIDGTSTLVLFAASGALNGTWRANGFIINNSDKNLKNSIEPLSTNYSTLFDMLNPVRFKYNSGTSGRYHTGFIAQDLQRAIFDSGLTEQEMAALCTVQSIDGEDEHMGIRYEEIIALCVNEIQKLKEKINILENTELIKGE